MRFLYILHESSLLSLRACSAKYLFGRMNRGRCGRQFKLPALNINGVVDIGRIEAKGRPNHERERAIRMFCCVYKTRCACFALQNSVTTHSQSVLLMADGQRRWKFACSVHTLHTTIHRMQTHPKMSQETNQTKTFGKATENRTKKQLPVSIVVDKSCIVINRKHMLTTYIYVIYCRGTIHANN